MKQKKKEKKKKGSSTFYQFSTHLQAGENFPLNFYLKQKVFISPLSIMLFQKPQ